MGTPNREPQEYSRNIIEYKDPCRFFPIIFLLYSWGSLFGVPIKVPLLILNPNLIPGHPFRASRSGIDKFPKPQTSKHFKLKL